MSRTIPDVPTGWKPPATDKGKTYEIELITPMFGGGVETRTNDPSFPIRPTAIRGQLQFWWRATVGAQYATPRELRSAQTEVWGNTEHASRVVVRVKVLEIGPSQPCAHFEPDRGDSRKFRSMPTWYPPFQNTSLPYALFPFQGQLAEGRREIAVEPASCIHKAKFQLTIVSHPSVDFATQVEPALWAWVNFGGLGSRTRRGCGAILCKDFAPQNPTNLKQMWQRFMPTLFPSREWPTLAECVLHYTEQPGAINAWDRVIEQFRHFRQGEGMGRNPRQPDSNRPNRSRWPEPETIRRVTRQRNGRHQRLTHIPDNAFPRAEFGLPIVFHFQNEKEDRPKDPEDTVLYPDQKRERMASPLILKPLALQNGKYVPLIVRLKTHPLEAVDLRQAEQSLPLPNPTLIRGSNLERYQNSPMQNRSSLGSAIEAFLAYAKSKGFTEVTRS